MYRVTLICTGIPAAAGPAAAADITNEFRQYRIHHTNVVCLWDSKNLILRADNDFDPNGLALMDEFSDCICAYIAEGFEGNIEVISVVQLDQSG